MAVRVFIHYLKEGEKLPTPDNYPDRIDFRDAVLGQITDELARAALLADLLAHNSPSLPEGVEVSFEYIDPNLQLN